MTFHLNLCTRPPIVVSDPSLSGPKLKISTAVDRVSETLIMTDPKLTKIDISTSLLSQTVSPSYFTLSYTFRGSGHGPRIFNELFTGDNNSVELGKLVETIW